MKSSKKEVQQYHQPYCTAIRKWLEIRENIDKLERLEITFDEFNQIIFDIISLPTNLRTDEYRLYFRSQIRIYFNYVFQRLKKAIAISTPQINNPQYYAELYRRAVHDWLEVKENATKLADSNFTLALFDQIIFDLIKLPDKFRSALYVKFFRNILRTDFKDVRSSLLKNSRRKKNKIKI